MKKLLNSLLLALLGWAMLAPAPAAADMYPSGLTKLSQAIRRGSDVLLPAGTTIVYLGDSITDYDRYGTGGVYTGAGHISRGRQGWVQRLLGFKGNVSPLYHSAYQGTLEPFTITYSLPILQNSGQQRIYVMQVGTNAVPGYSFEAVTGWDQTLIDSIIGAGDALVFESIQARTNEASSTTILRRKINDWRKSKADADTTGRLKYLDLTKTVSITDDGTTLPGSYISDTFFVHPTSYLAEREAISEAALLSSMIAAPTSQPWGYSPGTYDASTNVYGNRLANPAFSGTGGTKNNTVGDASTLPDNWVASRTTTRQSNAVAGTGTATTNIQAQFSVPTAGTLQIDVSGAGPGAINLSSANNLTANQTAGMRLMLVADYETVGLTGVNSFGLGLMTGTTGNFEMITGLASGNGSDSAEAPIAGDRSGTMIVTLAGGADTLLSNNRAVFNIVADNAATSLSGYIRLKNLRWHQIPDAIYDARFPPAESVRWRIAMDADATSGKIWEIAELGLRTAANAPNLMLKGGAGVPNYSTPSINFRVGVTAKTGNTAAVNGYLQDQDTSTVWATAAGDPASGSFITITSRAAFTLRQVEITSGANFATQAPTTLMHVQISKQAGAGPYTDWTDVWTFTPAPWTSAGQTQVFLKPTASLGSRDLPHMPANDNAPLEAAA